MPRRLLLALLLLVAAPLALLGWVSSTSMRQQSEFARQQLRAVLRSRLVEIDRTLSGVLDEHVRRLSSELDRPISTASNLRRLELTDPIARRGVLIDESGTILYPPQPSIDSPEQIAFYASLPTMIDSRTSVGIGSSDEQLQLLDSPELSQNVGIKPSSNNQQRVATRRGAANVPQQQRQALPSVVGAPH